MQGLKIAEEQQALFTDSYEVTYGYSNPVCNFDDLWEEKAGVDEEEQPFPGG